MESGLVVVDVQPAYDKWCGGIARSIARRINNTRKPTVVFWVGQGLTDDTEGDVMDYLHQHGARPGKLDGVKFIEKDFGFFRNWMDNGICDADIIEAGKALLASKAESLRMLGGPWRQVEKKGGPLWMPVLEQNWLNFFDGFDTCGGGYAECLAEIELWLQIHDKRVNRISALTY